MRLQQLASELDANATSVALDLSQVHAADPSGVAAVRSLVLTLLAENRAVFLSGLLRTPAEALRAGLAQIAGVEYHTDLDRSLEMCENQVLDRSGTAYGTHMLPVEKNLLLQDLTPMEMQTILTLGHPCEVARGAPLFERGAAANGIWLIVSGEVSVLLDMGKDAARLATLGPGQFVGEMGLIDGQARSASARADSSVSGWQLDRHAIATLTEQHPAAALKITRNIAKELSLRLRSLSA
jgi:CRP-like cAMP-binding protein/ABC-type transporter Mla MlaB component